MTSLTSRPLEWNVAGTRVSLFPEGENLMFSAANGDVVVQKEKIPLRLYGMSYALNLAELFHEAIGRNLQKGMHASCFLPILCTDALKLQNGRYTPITNLRVALFARIDRAAQRVLTVSIGMVDESTGERHYFCSEHVDNNSMESFLLNSPQYNQPNADKRRNYEMSSYVKQFRVVVKYEDARDVLESIDFKRVSVFNRNVVLDEDSWAVTLLSAPSGSEYHSVGSHQQFGHAMIAIERPSNNRSLLYAHITTKANQEYPDLGKDQAYVDIFERNPSFPIPGIYGPTWSLPRDQVECLVCVIEHKRELCRQGLFVRFSKMGIARGKVIDGVLFTVPRRALRYSTIMDGLRRSAFRSYSPGDILVFYLLSAVMSKTEIWGDCENCADWCLNTVEEVQISFNISTLERLKATPNQLVEYLKEHPEAVSIRPLN